jgi:hypothetical protein
VSARLEGGALIVRIGSMRRAFLVGGALGFVEVSARESEATEATLRRLQA